MKRLIPIVLLGLVFVGLPPRASGASAPCASEVAEARKTLAASPDDLAALHAIERCTSGVALEGQYAERAKDVLEHSVVLSVVPQLLEMAQVKDLIPVVREVETKKTKTVADFLTLHALYEKLDRPEEQIRVLQQAAALDPSDPRPKLIMAQKLFHSGNAEAARQLYREYLATDGGERGGAYFRAYVTALAYPIPVVAVAIALNWVFGYLLLRRRSDAFLKTSFGKGSWSRRVFEGVCALAPVALGAQFVATAHALPFGILLLAALFEMAAVIGLPLWRFVHPVVRVLANAVGALFGVRFARLLAFVPTGWRVVIALASLLLVGAIAPMIPVPDVRYSVIVVGVLLFFGTIGSLVVSFLRSSSSLKTSLRWIGLASTLSFLVVYLATHWHQIGHPLMQGRLPAESAQDALVDYLILWLVCAALSVHLGKILADALATPVREMMWKVSAIEQGDFAARVEVPSRDEIGALGAAVNRMAVGLARRDFVERTFRRYVDKHVAERILSGGDADAHIRGQRMQAVILFADIRGFTSMSERLPPEAVVGLLNDYFERVVAIVRTHGGVIDKFIGDALLAVWGVPSPVEHGARRAVEAALAMQDEILDFNVQLKAKGTAAIGIGIGINAGEVVAGSLGSRDRMEYTVIGDVVNTAQRAESAALASQILVTDSVYAEVKDQVAATAMDDRRVKGKSQPLRFWSLARLQAQQPEKLSA